LLHYGRHIIDVDIQSPENSEVNMEISLAEYVVFELYHDELNFVNPSYQKFLDDFVSRLQEDLIPDEKYYLQHINNDLSQLAVSFASDSHQLSENWNKKFNIHVSHESHDIRKTVMHDLLLYKERRLNDIIQATKEALKETNDAIETDILLSEIRRLDNFKARVNKLLSRTIIPH
jgi:DNA primase